jgi:hypothetical protein
MIAKRTKKKPFRASKALKEVARDLIGSPRATIRETPKTKKSHPKHKPTLGQWLDFEQ